MKRIERLLAEIRCVIDHKRVLEVACGCGEFSLAAAAFAGQVDCIDLDEIRLLPEAKKNERIRFQIMEAQSMAFSSETFDTIVIYNAIGHLRGIVSRILKECMRVTKYDGTIYVISSFKMDRLTIEEELIPCLESFNIPFESEADPIYQRVKIRKLRGWQIQEDGK